MSKNWVNKPMRIMRLDYITEVQRFAKKNLAKVAKEVRTKYRCNVQWVMANLACSPGSGHIVTFNTPKYEKAKVLGNFDTLRDYLPHAEANGIKVLAYTNLHWFNYEFGDQHKDWEQMLADGRPYGRIYPLYGNGTTMCVNSPWRDWSYEMLKEIMRTGIAGVFLDGPVVFPRACFCTYCAKQFKEKYGAEIPRTENWSNLAWKQLVEFRNDSLAFYLRDAQAAVKSINPDAVIYLNGGSFSAGTRNTGRQQEKLQLYQDVNSAEAFIGLGSNTSPYFSSMAAKYLTSGTLPAIVYTHYALGAWHYLPLPPLEIELSIAQTVACGANPWFAVFDYAIEQNPKALIQPVNRIQGFIEDNEEYFTDTQPVADVAVLSSDQTKKYYLSNIKTLYEKVGSGKEEGLVVDTASTLTPEDTAKRKAICDGITDGSYIGVYNALAQAHVQFDIIMDNDLLTEKLKKYKTLILANTACLSDAQVKKVMEYVSAGGSVVNMFESGGYDEWGNPRDKNVLLTSLCGVKSIDGMYPTSPFEQYIKKVASGDKSIDAQISAVSDYDLIPRPAYCFNTKVAEDCVVPLRYMQPTAGAYTTLQPVSDYPAMVVHKHGKGAVVYFPNLIASAISQFRDHSQENVLVAAVRIALQNKLVVETTAPVSVEMYIRQKNGGKQVIVHMINLTADRPRLARETIPVRNFEVILHRPGLSKVKKLGSMKSVTAQHLDNGDGIKFKVGILELYDVYIVE
ncbi:MAG: alpha-amylase family protein [Elusimicrobiota bacterium]